MQFPIRMPGRLTRYGVFLMTTVVNMNGCTVSAEETMAPSQLASSEVVAARERQTLSPEVQFREIQKILEEIDNAPKNAQPNTHNPSANLPIKSATESVGTSNAMRMAGDASSNQFKLDMGKSKGKGKMMKGASPASNGATGMGNMMEDMSSDTQASSGPMGMCKGVMCKKMNMSMMGQRPISQVSSTQATENLPGYPQAPHLYHMGEVDFFLDHTQYLSLTSQQGDSLIAIKNEWMSQQENINVQTSTLEQALWQATAQGQPDIADIRKKVADIEALNGQLRLTFITRVGNAVNTLTPEQVELLMSAEKLP